MTYKIEAIVKFNDGEALVLDRFPEVKYERHGRYLFGIDEIWNKIQFDDVLCYDCFCDKCREVGIFTVWKLK